MSSERYSLNELKILHYMKKHNGVVTGGKGKSGRSVTAKLAQHCGIGRSTVNGILKKLEDRCLLVRTYASGKTGQFAAGWDAIVKIELVDPNITLPPLPLPPAVNMKIENNTLLEKAIDLNPPSENQVWEALVARCEELVAQNDKLFTVIQEQQAEIAHTIPVEPLAA